MSISDLIEDAFWQSVGTGSFKLSKPQVVDATFALVYTEIESHPRLESETT